MLYTDDGMLNNSEGQTNIDKYMDEQSWNRNLSKNVVAKYWWWDATLIYSKFNSPRNLI